MVHQDLLGPIFQSRTLKHVSWRAVLFGAYAGLAVWKENSSWAAVGDVPSEVQSAMTFMVGLLLVFRTNAAYNRWWEARTLWGTLVNASRNLAVKLATLGAIPRPQVDAAGSLIVAFARALKEHLRDRPPDQVAAHVGWPVEVQHVPANLVHRLYSLVGEWKAAGAIDGDELRVFDRELAKLLDVCGGCERILRTRIARSYRAFARQCVLLHLFAMPWGIVHEFQWWTIPLTVITAYFMLGLEIVAEHVEEPFGFDEDDLDLDGMCAAIDRSVHEILETGWNKSEQKA